MSGQTTRCENEISGELEYRIKVTCKAENLRQTMEAVKAVHPYEEPVINVIPLYQVGIDVLKQGESVTGESDGKNRTDGLGQPGS